MDWRRGKQLYHFGFAQTVGQWAIEFGGGEAGGRVGADPLLAQQKTEQPLQTGQFARRRAGAQCLSHQLDLVALHIVARGVQQVAPALLAQPVGEQLQVDPVAVQRVARQAFLQPQAVAKGIQ